ncbi:MAG: transcriptional repressor [Muribaculaceae bacterium]|nr:transcriptional repressor [Muribaculaceae bacterium]
MKPSNGHTETSGLKTPEECVLSRELHARGLRTTPERKALYEVIIAAGGNYRTARQLGEAVAANGLRLNRATVYNTLDILLELGLIRRKTVSGTDNGQIQWAYAAESGERKRSLTVELVLECRVCGKVKVARDRELTNYLRRHRFTGFDTIQGTADLRISCVCNRCRRAEVEKSAAMQK